MNPTAAGIMFLHDGRVLLMKRAGAPHAGTWALPGGGIEAGETPEDAARRETREECDYTYDGPIAPLWQTRDGFACYGAVIDKAFDPKLNNEHHEAKWSSFDDLPSPLHPSMAEGIAILPGAKAPPTRAVDATCDPIRLAFDSLHRVANDCMAIK
jgi:ADP-ribose pyrophosphatase YjhB (NUDIX family)